MHSVTATPLHPKAIPPRLKMLHIWLIHHSNQSSLLILAHPVTSMPTRKTSTPTISHQLDPSMDLAIASELLKVMVKPNYLLNCLVVVALISNCRKPALYLTLLQH